MKITRNQTSSKLGNNKSISAPNYISDDIKKPTLSFILLQVL